MLMWNDDLGATLRARRRTTSSDDACTPRVLHAELCFGSRKARGRETTRAAAFLLRAANGCKTIDIPKFLIALVVRVFAKCTWKSWRSDRKYKRKSPEDVELRSTSEKRVCPRVSSKITRTQRPFLDALAFCCLMQCRVAKASRRSSDVRCRNTGRTHWLVAYCEISRTDAGALEYASFQ